MLQLFNRVHRFFRLPYFAEPNLFPHARYYLSLKPPPRGQTVQPQQRQQRPAPVEIRYSQGGSRIKLLRLFEGATYIIALYYGVRFFLDPLEDEEDEPEELSGLAARDSAKPKDEHDDAVFIPVLATPLVREKYPSTRRGGSPTSADPQLDWDRLMGKLGNVATVILRSDPNITSYIGTPVRPSAALTFSRDFFTEIEYDCVLPGLEFRRDGIRVVERKVPHEEATSLLRAFNPLILLRAFYQTEKTFLQYHWSRFKGGKMSSPGESFETESLPSSSSSPDSENVNQKGQDRSSTAPLNTKEPSGSAENLFPSLDELSLEGVSRYLANDNPLLRREWLRLFLRCLARERHKIYVPPPGSIPISGEAHFQGRIRPYTLKFWAIYDPKGKRFCEIQVESKSGPHVKKTVYNLPAE